MRSTMFITASLIVHAICFTALALNHFRSGGDSETAGTEVEVTMGEGTKVADASGALTEVPEVKPLPIKEEVKPVEEKKLLAKKTAKKVSKVQPQAKVQKELPAKEFIAETQLPQDLNPELEESEEKVELIPVKDLPPAGVQAQTSPEAEDKATEAVSTDLSETKDPSPVTTEASGDAGKGASTEPMLNKGGETKAEAVSYLELKQYSGNKPPAYPMSARRDQRQGQVDLLYRVAKDGHVAEVQVAKSSGHPDLDEAAVKAIAKFRYVPGQEGWARHPVIFSIKGAVTALPSKLRGSAASAE